MKRLLLLLTVFTLLITGCSSKTSFDVDKLIGKWRAVENDYEDGMEGKLVLDVEFINSTDLEIEATFYIEGISFGKINANGTYKAKGDVIDIDIDNDDIRISLDRDFFDSSAEYNLTMKEMRKEFLDEDLGGESKVIKLTKSELILEEEGELIEFSRVGR